MTLKVEKESEQIQQMFNMGKGKTALKLIVIETYDYLNKIKFMDEPVVDHLNW